MDPRLGVGVENTWGALKGRTTAGPLTFGRISTDDAEGRVKAYFGEGELTNDPLNTFGTRADAHVPDLDRLMRHIGKKGFEHHAVMTQSRTARVLRFGKAPLPEVHRTAPDFQFGRSFEVCSGTDIALVGTGETVGYLLLAVGRLAE